MRRFIPFSLVLIIFACSSRDSSILPKDQPVELVVAEGLTLVDGTIKYVELEGGVWCIEDTNGNLYVHYNFDTFPEVLKQEGLKGLFVVEILENQNSYIMFGISVRLVNYKITG